MLMWRNMLANGSCDGRTRHLSRQVRTGHKIILQRWFHLRAHNLLNFKPDGPNFDGYLPHQPLVACDGVGMCRKYNHWGVNWLKQH